MEKIVTSYDQVNGNALLDVCIAILKNQEQVYGPAYGRLAKKNAIIFAAKKFGESPVEEAQEWDWTQVKEYLQKNQNKYSHGYNALIYAMGKTESTLQGSTGSSQRISATQVAKSLESGKTEEVTNLEDAWKKSVDKLVFFGLMPTKVSYKVEDESTVTYMVEDCPFRDCCEAFISEKIRKMDGRQICALGRMMSSDIGQKLKAGCDYYVDNFANPSCKGRIVEIL
ncbi:MAG: hypothetical protein KIH08_16920 [Candidatus Freyarchaeota archaeon]|nr:hypothetical protein [Candidatus Jordarchaeia archaeon]MBS7279029.1 hypothetical protein [Candidatus Jordarchaeia archaeon]